MILENMVRFLVMDACKDEVAFNERKYDFEKFLDEYDSLKDDFLKEYKLDCFTEDFGEDNG